MGIFKMFSNTIPLSLPIHNILIHPFILFSFFYLTWFLFYFLLSLPPSISFIYYFCPSQGGNFEHHNNTLCISFAVFCFVVLGGALGDFMCSERIFTPFSGWMLILPSQLAFSHCWHCWLSPQGQATQSRDPPCSWNLSKSTDVQIITQKHKKKEEQGMWFL